MADIQIHTAQTNRPDRSSGLLGRWKTLLVECWRDPASSVEQAAAYRGRQLHTVRLPLVHTGIANVIVAVALAIIFWGKPSHIAMTGWALTVSFFSIVNGLTGWREFFVEEALPASKKTVVQFSLSLAVTGFVFASMPWYLFHLVNANERALLGTILVAFITIGSWMIAYLPMAALAWTFTLCLGTILAFLSVGETFFDYAAVLLGFLGLITCLTVLITSRTFLNGLKAEAETEHQKQWVGLLLNDFEENASDWLWETDRDGNLRHVAPQLAKALGLAPEGLQGQSLLALVSSLGTQLRKGDRTQSEKLKTCLMNDLPFRDLVVPVLIESHLCRWSLTGKPLKDATGQVLGWRGVGSDISAQWQQEQELTRLANEDTLTGLANRHRFGLKLATYFGDAAAIKPCTLFLFDLDNFKNLNDSLGHNAGDQLLIEVARRLASEVYGEELLARLGGDEFVILVPGEMKKTDAEAFGLILQTRLNKSWTVDGHRIVIRSSIGIGFAPSNATSAEQLLRVCDMALYAAKAAGRNTMRFFDPAMSLLANRKIKLLSDMTEGLQRGEFRLHYQPQVDLHTGALVGFEALVRWQHPVRGMVMPVEFIHVAEESGLIVSLGAWVLQQACRDAMLWPTHLRVAVNLSAAQFDSADLMPMVQAALLDSRLLSTRLELEMTESILFQDSQEALQTLQGIRRMGVRIALDDFGTGYSSLAYLRTFPMDKLKIDRSFIAILDAPQQDSSAIAIVQAIVQLAQALQLDTTAEGVETPAQWSTLRQIGCKLAQGYLIAMPMDMDDTLAFIAARPMLAGAVAHA
jgi:diguanylate cyclase (GGDEF)-like protein